MSGCAGVPAGRAEALASLRLGFEVLSGQVGRLDAVRSDAELRTLLLAVVDQAWAVRDRAVSAYAVLDVERDAGGIARGVVE